MRRNTRSTIKVAQPQADRWSERGQKIRREQEKSLYNIKVEKENTNNGEKKEKEENSKKTKESRKMESKIFMNNNMIKYEKLTTEQMSAIYYILGIRYYEGIPETYDVEWKGDIDYKREDMPDNIENLMKREKKITTIITEGKQEMLKMNLNIKEKTFTIKGTLWKKWEEYEQHHLEELIKEYEELITEFDEMESIERLKDSIKGSGKWEIPVTTRQEVKTQNKESEKSKEGKCRNTGKGKETIECSNEGIESKTIEYNNIGKENEITESSNTGEESETTERSNVGIENRREEKGTDTVDKLNENLNENIVEEQREIIERQIKKIAEYEKKVKKKDEEIKQLKLANKTKDMIFEQVIKEKAERITQLIEENVEKTKEDTAIIKIMKNKQQTYSDKDLNESMKNSKTDILKRYNPFEKEKMEETAEERLESVLNHPDWFIRSPTIHETERKKCQKEDIIHFEIQTDKQSKQKNLETRRKNGEINNEEYNLNHPEWFQRSKILYQKTEEDDNNKSMTKNKQGNSNRENERDNKREGNNTWNENNKIMETTREYKVEKAKYNEHRNEIYSQQMKNDKEIEIQRQEDNEYRRMMNDFNKGNTNRENETDTRKKGNNIWNENNKHIESTDEYHKREKMRYNDNRNEIYRQQWNSNKEIQTQEKHNEYRRRMSKSNTWEREVPRAFWGKEGTEKICYRCNKKGHIAKDCSMRENRKCFICKKVGHIAENCRYRTVPYVKKDKQVEEDIYKEEENTDNMETKNLEMLAQMLKDVMKQLSQQNQ